MNITKISIERPTLVVVVFALFTILGAISYYSLNYELVPKFTPPTVAVTSVFPGASPLSVEQDVTIPVENALSSLNNVVRINSSSQENFSLVRVELTNTANITESLREAERKLELITDDLPDNVTPVISRFDFDDLAVLRLGVESNLHVLALNDLIENQIQPSLSQVEGVAEVRILGGIQQTIDVDIDPAKLSAFGVSIIQVDHAIKTGNIDLPIGDIAARDSRFQVRLQGKFANLEELKRLPVGRNVSGGVITLTDIAVINPDTRRDVITRINGKQSVGIEIRKQSSANAVEMSAEVKSRLTSLEESYSGQGLKFTLASDSSEFTLKAANAVMQDLGLAVILVSLVMLLFLHSLRSALIVIVSIPTSIITTLIVMYVLGFTLNLMTLLGLSLAIGILVDDSIVVLENIHRHLEMGKNRVKSAFDGRMEIGFTALSITLVDVVVFMPILFAQGIVADLFAQFSIVMISSTLISLLVSFTLVPLIASRYSKLVHVNGDGWSEKLVVSFESFISRQVDHIASILTRALQYKWLTCAIALFIFIGSLNLVIFGLIGTEFTKAGDRGEFILEVELPPSSTLLRSNQAAIQIENYLLQIPEVETVFTTVGLTSSGRIESNPSYISEFLVKLTDKEDRDYSAAVLARKIKLDLMGNIPDLKVTPIEVNLIGLREDGAVEVTLFGPDLNSIQEVAEDVQRTLDEVPGTVEVRSNASVSAIDLQLRIDHRRRAEMGINLGQAAFVMRAAFHGTNPGSMNYNGQDREIWLQTDEDFKKRRSDLEIIRVPNDAGQLISIDQFASINETATAPRIERTNRSQSITIKSQVIGRTGGSVGNEFQQKMDDIDLPADVSYVFTGQLQRLFEGFQTLAIALVASVLFVYLILVALYDSYIYPLVVLFSIPMAIVGALLLMALTMESLNIFSIMGLIMLVGLVGKNAILVVDFTNKLRIEGESMHEALITATKLRFRPVLMTNLSMVIGLMPIALATGAGSEWKNGLAVALIGGLSSSMFLSLILVPVVYSLMDRFVKPKTIASVD